jgi:hypothetical protein
LKQNYKLNLLRNIDDMSIESYAMISTQTVEKKTGIIRINSQLTRQFDKAKNLNNLIFAKEISELRIQKLKLNSCNGVDPRLSKCGPEA